MDTWKCTRCNCGCSHGRCRHNYTLAIKVSQPWTIHIPDFVGALTHAHTHIEACAQTGIIIGEPQFGLGSYYGSRSKLNESPPSGKSLGNAAACVRVMSCPAKSVYILERKGHLITWKCKKCRKDELKMTGSGYSCHGLKHLLVRNGVVGIKLWRGGFRNDKTLTTLLQGEIITDNFGFLW